MDTKNCSAEPNQKALKEAQGADVLFIAANARSLIYNRGWLVRDMCKRGLRVAALVPCYEYISDAEDLGIPIILYDLNRHSTNPVIFIRQFWNIFSLVRKLSPKTVFSYSIKPNILGTLAARLAGTRYTYCLVTGLGYVFASKQLKAKLVRRLSLSLCAVSGCLSQLYIFQNPDDCSELKQHWLFRKTANTIVVKGSGVDLTHYAFRQIPKESPFTFLCLARLFKEKGIYEFVKAAKIVKNYFPDTRFMLVGGHDPNLSTAIPNRILTKWKQENTVEIYDAVKDVRPWIEQCSVFVLPSYYREGTPRSILEAMSMGRAIITCDTPGCRETVVDGKNGFLVPPRRSEPLAKAMQRFLRQPEIVPQMGEASWQMAKKYYDVHKVNKAILDAMELF